MNKHSLIILIAVFFAFNCKKKETPVVEPIEVKDVSYTVYYSHIYHFNTPDSLFAFFSFAFGVNSANIIKTDSLNHGGLTNSSLNKKMVNTFLPGSINSYTCDVRRTYTFKDTAQIKFFFTIGAQSRDTTTGTYQLPKKDISEISGLGITRNDEKTPIFQATAYGIKSGTFNLQNIQ